MTTAIFTPTRLPDGFPGQRMRVLPRPVVALALRAPTTAQILVTDVGFFPRASSHGRVRPRGARQNIVIVCAAGRGVCHLPSGSHRIAVRAVAGNGEPQTAVRAEPFPDGASGIHELLVTVR